MKLVNAGLKSRREMMEYLILNGDLYSCDGKERFYFSEDGALRGDPCFFVSGPNGYTDKIESAWGCYKEMHMERTLRQAVDNFKTVPCWTDGDKLEICMIYKYNEDSGMFISTDHDHHFTDPVPLEAEDLL